MPFDPGGAAGRPHSDSVPFGLGFPVTLARFAARFPRGVIAVFAVIGVVFSLFATRLHEADDLLDFIPPNDPDVRVFREVSRTFGSLRVALVGIEAPKEEGDVFSPKMIERIDALTNAIRNLHGVDSVDSLTSVEDIVPGPMGAEAQQLVKAPPANESERKALREKVLSRELIVGNFVTADGTAALLVIKLADGAPDRAMAHALRKEVEAERRGLRVVYGGAPFAAASIYDETQDDIRRLTPLAVLLILGVILVAFRDPVGVVLTILTVAWAAAVVLGGMALLHEPFTAASGTLPVILFASGTSYAVHLLGRYYALGGAVEQADAGRWKLEGEPGESRMITATRIVGPPVAIAGFTTSAGFFSFLVMDIRPMRAFGLECALGVLLCMLAALLLVPATIALWPRRNSRPASTGALGEQLGAVAGFARRHKRAVAMTSLALGLVCIGPMRRVAVRMEARAFFRRGSEPWLAERFLTERFGGSQLLGVDVTGDITEPATLREIKRLTQFARALPGVTQVQSVCGPLELVNEGLGAGHRLPDTQTQVPSLLLLIEGRPIIRALLSPGHDQTLVLVRIEGEVAPVVAAVEDYLAHKLDRTPSAPTRAIVAERIRWITAGAGDPLAEDAIARALDAAHPVEPDDARLVEAKKTLARNVINGLRETAREAQGAVDPRLDVDELADLASHAVTPERIEAARARFQKLAASPEEGTFGWNDFTSQAAERAREIAVDDAMKPVGPVAAGTVREVRDAIGDLFPVVPLARSKVKLGAALAGEPILNRGMSRSVGKNQEESLLVSIIAVIALMALLFRSGYLALLSVWPSALSLATIFGTMGLFGVNIDLGTSLVASIATGAGSDFAMHYLWYLKRSTPREVASFVGPIMVISVLLIAAGFAVLSLGNSQPMRMFGTMAALSMLLSALLTFLLVPALLRRVDAAAPPSDKETA